MSVSAAELPAMSSIASGDPGAMEQLRRRLDAGLRRIAFFIVPSAVAFLALGDVIAGALFQTGRFERADTLYVWGILAGSAVGLLASTLGRLYSSTYYALRDTKSPLRYAIVRVVLTTVLGYVFAIPLPRALGVELSWGAAGLTASAGIAGWVEMLLLRVDVERAHRPDGSAGGVRRAALGIRDRRRGGRVGSEIRAAAAASDRDRRRRPRPLRRRVLRDDVPASDPGSVERLCARRER